jgi:hypothetical protein
VRLSALESFADQFTEQTVAVCDLLIHFRFLCSASVWLAKRLGLTMSISSRGSHSICLNF